MRVTLLALLALACACGPPTQKPAPEIPVDPNLPPNFELSDASVPTRYLLRLAIDPEVVSFEGEVIIDVELAAALSTFWLHQKGLTIQNAHFKRAEQTVALQAIGAKDDSELLGLVSTEELPAGPGQLQIRFSGELGSLQALFRQFQDGRWYAYSDFEATDARAAFPCYDEPRFKVPWRVEILAPSEMLAFANAPEIAREKQEGGRTLFRFAETRPLPSYLVAVAVGPFDMIEGKASNTPLRIIAPKGNAEHGRFVLENTGRWIRYLESYLDMPMPFPKLDFIAVPVFGGAMENPGLVTFSANILLVSPNAGAHQRRRAAGVTSHELAHMWFGNLLTPRAWNDLWLNEGFATWLSDKMVAAWQPAQAREILDIADKSTAFESDHEVGGRVVREPVSSRQDIRSAFDAITYRKGGALLTMLEGWLGEEKMKEAVRSYLHAHNGGSVTTPDLVKAMRAAAPKRAVKKILESFLTQTGIPTVEATLHCDAKTVVELTQSRYLPVAAEARAREFERDALWNIPTCLRYPTEAGVVRQCVLLRKKKQRVRLRSTQCPSWILPNDRESGYYHYLLDDAGFHALANADLDPREQLGLVHNLIAALESGDMGVAAVLDELEAYAPLGSLAVQQAVIPMLYQLEQSVVGPAERPGFAARVRQWYRPRLAQIGLVSRTGEPETDEQLRPVLIHLLAELGDDQDLQKRARGIIDAWLEKPERMDLQILDALLQAAAMGGDARLARQYREAIDQSKDRRHAAILLSALHAFTDPVILQSALDLSLPSQLRLPNLVPVLMRLTASPKRRKLLLGELVAKRDALLASMPKGAAKPPPGDKEKRERRAQNFDRLAPIFAKLCDADGKALVQRFADKEFDAQPIIDAIDGCMAFAKAQGQSAKAAFSGDSK